MPYLDPDLLRDRPFIRGQRLGLAAVACMAALIVVCAPGASARATGALSTASPASTVSTTQVATQTAQATAPAAPATQTAAPTHAAGSAKGTRWLCRPGLPKNPCTVSPDATSVGPTGAKSVHQAHDAVHSPFDCFYLYPTVVRGPGLNAPLAVQPAIRQTAIEQASRFSQVCQVWAPVYRQATIRGLLRSLQPSSPVATAAYNSLLAAWRDFLAHDDDGRPIIFIGHSQGASLLIKLLQQEVDPDPALRARVVAALLIGGNVQVPTGKVKGGTFTHLPLCTATVRTGCVIAYSSFDQMPPSNSNFGIAGQGVSLLSGQGNAAGQQVACVNPAAIGGGTAPLQPYFAKPNSTGTNATWVTYPQLYTATCKHEHNVTWLQVTARHSKTDTRPVVTQNRGPTFGLHTYDVNLALGNLVDDVQAAEAAFRARHR